MTNLVDRTRVAMARALVAVVELHAVDQRYREHDIFVCTQCGKAHPCPTVREIAREIARALTDEGQSVMADRGQS